MNAKSNRFGMIALGLEYLTEEQLSHALGRQQHLNRRGPHRRLGEICIDLGYLAPEQIETIMERIRILSVPFLTNRLRANSPPRKEFILQSDNFELGSSQPVRESAEDIRADGVTLPDAAKLLRVSESDIRSRIMHGELEAWRIPGESGMEWRVALPLSTHDSLDSSVPSSVDLQKSEPMTFPPPSIPVSSTTPAQESFTPAVEDMVPGGLYRELMKKYESTLGLAHQVMSQLEQLTQREAEAKARIAQLEQLLEEKLRKTH